MVNNAIAQSNEVDPYAEIKRARKRMKFLIILTQKIIGSRNCTPHTTQFIFTVLQNYVMAMVLHDYSVCIENVIANLQNKLEISIEKTGENSEDITVTIEDYEKFMEKFRELSKEISKFLNRTTDAFVE